MPRPPVPDPESCALFLDIDGTLLEHCPHPEGVIVAPRLAETLAALSLRLDGALAFVTGRDLAMVDRLFGDLELAAAGVYGMERRLAGKPPEPAVNHGAVPANRSAAFGKIRSPHAAACPAGPKLPAGP